MRWRSRGWVLALVSVALLVAGPLGTRLGLWTFLAGFALFALSALLALVAAALSFVAAFRTSDWRRAVPGALLGLAVLAVPISQVVRAGGAPPIHDITTDTTDPPAFVAVLPLRAGADNPPEYGGAEVAAQQQQAFPDIQPVMLQAAPDQAFGRALTAVGELGWDVIASAPSEGRIEAVATTFWFGFKDDVVIRLRPADGGTRVDVRSKSRVGVGDAGTNARRVRAFLEALKAGGPL